MKSAEIRSKFLQFYAGKGHTVVPSDSLIPSGDPTLLFSSAGMVQFKQHFLGQARDSFTRATSCQKCFRTSDIEQVGRTSRHLTFFEMLGNFSFGDYFKAEAIAWAWEFLTKELNLPADKLHITIYKDDNEAFEIWKKIVPESRIYRMGDDTNFWNMGPTGPCGPCSEILFDQGPEVGCRTPGCKVGCECDRYLEVWNLVFTQYDRQPDGSLKNLPRKNIDTGMGLERLVAVVQGKHSNFETDLFEPIIASLSQKLGVKEPEQTFALRMMADHCRAIAFLISDGILPSNEGRGYVLRRILRRALRQGKMLGMNKPFLYQVTAEVCDFMKVAYPELGQRRENIANITKMEEEKFLETLESGTKILEEIMDRYRSGDVLKGGNAVVTKFTIPGTEVFKLYDTYGFPLDLTREIAREQGLSIDEEGFAAAQKEAQAKSRAAWSGSGEKDVTLYAELHKATGNIPFVGYERLTGSTKVLAVLKGGKKIDTLAAGEEGEVILAETPFYAESGGQVGDRGQLRIRDEQNRETTVAQVTDTRRPVNGLVVHHVKAVKGQLETGQPVEAVVDEERRLNIVRHHTATHLLHKALRDVLGTHVTQAGSLVTPDNFRFDFTHMAALKPEEIRAVEEIVNESIRWNMPVCIDDMTLEDARKKGAMALFGEKYGERVRAVSITLNETPFSMELCGGTHVHRTGDIGMFKIVAESSVAAGTRRIEAVAGRASENHVAHMERVLQDAASRLRISRDELPARIDKLLSREKELEREVSRLKSQLASGGMADLTKNVREINGIKTLAARVPDLDQESIRGLADNLKNKLGSGVVILAGTEGEKASFVVIVSPDLVKTGYHAGKIAKKLASLIGGSGGGKPDFAQGGGKDISNLDSALDKLQVLLVP